MKTTDTVTAAHTILSALKDAPSRFHHSLVVAALNEFRDNVKAEVRNSPDFACNEVERAALTVTRYKQSQKEIADTEAQTRGRTSRMMRANK